MSAPLPKKTPMMIALIGSGILALIAAFMLWWVSKNSPQDNTNNADVIAVKVGSDSCDPMRLSVLAGKRNFEIENISQRTVEWEILSGVMVLAERENILPGFKSRLSVTLAPGEYDITCGLLTNPRGKMVVTNSNEWQAAVAAQPGNHEFLRPLSEYRVYLVMESRKLLSALDKLTAAIAQNNVEESKKAWVESRLHYQRLDSFSSRFSDLEAKMNPQAQYLAKRENDTAFVGFHRIEYGLWQQNATTELMPFISDLIIAANDLNTRINDSKVSANEMLMSAQNMTQKWIDTLTNDTGINQWAKGDGVEMAASMYGIKKISNLMSALVEHSAPQLEVQINDTLNHVTSILNDGINEAGDLTADKKQLVLTDLKTLTLQLTELQQKLGF